ncbi:MAG: tetratricopeptide repeat protein [Minicystis sp.]
MVVRPCSVVLVALAVLLGPGAAWADPPKLVVARDADDAKRAAALNDEAWALYEQGRYRAAVEKLEQAQSLDPNGKDLFYNLALIHEKLGDLKEAAAHYRRYLEMETDPKAKARAQATIRRLEGAEREREEAAARAASAAGPRREAGAPPPEASRPVRPAVLVAGGVAGASLLVGSMFALSAVARNPGAVAHTGDGTGIEDVQDAARTAHTHAVVADVSFAVAAGAAVVATVLYFTTPRGAPPARTASRVTVGPAALGVRF